MKNNLSEPENQELWHDKKRILGMPISFTRYSVEPDRFIAKVGFFRTEVNEILLYRILDIKMVRTLGQKIFGVGTITLYTADSNQSTFEVKNIKKPDKVRRFLSRIIEQRREEKRVQGKEMFGVAGGYRGDHDPVTPEHFEDIDGDGIPD